MRIKLLVDHRGRETNEAFYPAGHELDLSPYWADLLIANGRAVAMVDEPEPNPEPKPKAVVKRGRKRTAK